MRCAISALHKANWLPCFVFASLLIGLRNTTLINVKIVLASTGGGDSISRSVSLDFKKM